MWNNLITNLHLFGVDPLMTALISIFIVVFFITVTCFIKLAIIYRKEAKDKARLERYKKYNIK